LVAIVYLGGEEEEGHKNNAKKGGMKGGRIKSSEMGCL